MTQAKLLVEEVLGRPARVDAENGVLHDCLLLGHTSKNGVHYPDATRERALPLFEGAKVNLSHPAKRDKGAMSEPVTWDRRYGKATNVRNTPDGIRGDVKVLKKHPFTVTLMEAAQEMPEMFGFSPVMLGVCSPADRQGVETCTEIRRLKSVDIVTDPGTTKTLFEDEAAPPAPDVPEGGEQLPEGTKHHEAALMHIILDEIEAFLDEELEPEETTGRIKEHLKHHVKMHREAKEEPKEEAKEEEAPKEEAKEEEKEEHDRWSLRPRAGEKVLTEEEAPRKRVEVKKPKSGIQPAKTKQPTDDAGWAALLRGSN